MLAVIQKADINMYEYVIISVAFNRDFEKQDTDAQYKTCYILVSLEPLRNLRAS